MRQMTLVVINFPIYSVLHIWRHVEAMVSQRLFKRIRVDGFMDYLLIRSAFIASRSALYLMSLFGSSDRLEWSWIYFKDTYGNLSVTV